MISSTLVALTTIGRAVPVPLRQPLPSPVPAPARAPAGGGSPSPSAECRSEELCKLVWEYTGVAWLAEGSFWIMIKPLRIALIILLAVVARWVISRTISRLVRHTAESAGPDLLKPLREKMSTTVREATGLPSERRRQRAQALGSVLRSIASAIIFAVAVMLVLAELGVNIGPILASAGVVGLAIGFGAQNLVKDFLSGLFMLLEDQYGVGDVIDVGEISGTVEAVGLRITTIRDGQGMLWYIRNGEMTRVGNKSQGWALVTVDVPVTFLMVEPATVVLREAAATLVDDPDFADDLIAAPEVLGVEQITADGATLRTTVKTTSDAQWRVGRELRNRLVEALRSAGMTSEANGGRISVRQTASAPVAETGQGGPT